MTCRHSDERDDGATCAEIEARHAGEGVTMINQTEYRVKCWRSSQRECLDYIAFAQRGLYELRVALEAGQYGPSQRVVDSVRTALRGDRFEPPLSERLRRLDEALHMLLVHGDLVSDARDRAACSAISRRAASDRSAGFNPIAQD